ncbi:S1C family serine protease [uncultured Cellulomonas sp.]|uniref:S1C family serine protease n=1 Tax=uncultured Cellulomonas sp. TaxID=189682 RepID=UPI002622FBF8|nr:trypsin-like peptidase domain-containing protein [uncultured Cellulomonas sp.]
MNEHDQAPQAARTDDATAPHPHHHDQPTQTFRAPDATQAMPTARTDATAPMPVAPTQPVAPMPTVAGAAPTDGPAPVGTPVPDWTLGSPSPTSPAGAHPTGTGAGAAPAWATAQGPAGPGIPGTTDWGAQATAGQPQGTARTDRRRPTWLPLVSTAAATAVLASVATVGLTGGFGEERTTTPSSLAAIGQTSTATVPVSGSTSDNPDWESVASAVSASVVAIQVSTANGGGEGSGVIIDKDGHILTNNHVVAGAEEDTVQVTLTDGRLFTATIVGLDPSTDLAIVKIDDVPDDLQPAAFGDSDDVIVGAPVMAVGNPLGLANTVTTGIVSAIDRPVSASSSSATRASDVVVTNAIQIDAAVNPGNSGGPLFDAEGRVIGITSSIATLSSGGSQSGSIGLGFSIPVNLARDVAAQLVEDGTAEHAFLGVSLSDGTATADGVTRRGAVVEQVTSGSPAQAADLEQGDVIVAIDGDAVAGAESLTAYVRERASGDATELTVVRDGQALDVTVTLATREDALTSQDSGSQDSSDDGLQLPGLDGSGDPTNPNNVPGFDWFGGRG